METREYVTPSGIVVVENSIIFIISGEGEIGTREKYTGKKSARALRRRLTIEAANGERWSYAEIDGYRVDYEYISNWLD